MSPSDSRAASKCVAHRRLVADVDAERHRARAVPRKPLGDAARARFVEIGDDDVRAGARELAADRGTEAAPAARDERGPAGERRAGDWIGG
ncbi:hypothetical protein X892_3265 [Burkholderia pseudomallei MSHR3960]|nr:hypothetical protein X892_3265 [Burkholderia pseudomallei MSHR3960]